MELLERYLTQIERYLPFKERSETTKELRNLILDQLDEAVSNGSEKETALYNIIVEMGEPRDVANNYVETRPFISKELEPILRLVLKIATITLPLTLTFGKMLDYVLNNENTTVMDNLLNIVYTIPQTLYSLLIGYGVIFIIFFLIERYIHPKFEMPEKEFNPNLLPKIPTKHFKVSLFESIFSILATTLIVYLFNMRTGLITVFIDGDAYPLFNSTFDSILPFINIGWFISIGLNIYYLFKRMKNIPTKTIELLHHIYSGVIFIVLATSSPFTQLVIDENGITVIPTVFKVVFIFLGVAVILGGIVEYLKTYVNLEALKELDKK